MIKMINAGPTFVIDPDDFFSTFERELSEPVTGEEFDVLPEDSTPSWDEEWALICRRENRCGRPVRKPRAKK
jgi:hypothetical protein